MKTIKEYKQILNTGEHGVSLLGIVEDTGGFVRNYGYCNVVVKNANNGNTVTLFYGYTADARKMFDLLSGVLCEEPDNG